MTNKQAYKGSMRRLVWMTNALGRDEGRWSDEVWEKMFELRDLIQDTLGKEILRNEFWTEKPL